MNWFKFYGQDFLTDPKIKKLYPLDQLAFIYLLCLGSQKTGRIDYLDEDTLKHMMNLSTLDEEWALFDGVFERLQKMGMITISDNASIVITNYEKRQNTNLTGYERVRRSRLKKKGIVINDNISDNTDDNDRIDKNRKEENIKEEEVVSSPGKKINNLSLTRGQEMAFLREFPGLNSRELKVEIDKCNNYMAMSSGVYTNPGLFFKGWLKKYMEEKAKARVKAEEQVKQEKAITEDVRTPEQIEAANKKLAEIRANLNRKVRMN